MRDLNDMRSFREPQLQRNSQKSSASYNRKVPCCRTIYNLKRNRKTSVQAAQSPSTQIKNFPYAGHELSQSSKSRFAVARRDLTGIRRSRLVKPSTLNYRMRLLHDTILRSRRCNRETLIDWFIPTLHLL